MQLKEAKKILSLVANDPDGGTRGAWENQDRAAQIILDELQRLEHENKTLKTKMKTEEPL